MIVLRKSDREQTEIGYGDQGKLLFHFQVKWYLRTERKSATTWRISEEKLGSQGEITQSIKMKEKVKEKVEKELC